MDAGHVRKIQKVAGAGWSGLTMTTIEMSAAVQAMGSGVRRLARSDEVWVPGALHDFCPFFRRSTGIPVLRGTPDYWGGLECHADACERHP